MELYELQKNDEIAWDEYVLKHSDSTFYHQIGWKHVIEKTYGYKSYYLIANENDKIVGVLPLFLMDSRIFGKKLISLPFAPFGGIIVDDEKIKIDLMEEAKKITRQLRCKYLEIRSLNELVDVEYITNSSYITFIIRLDSGLEVILEKLRRDKRKGIKKAQKANLETEWSTTVNDFYNVYIQNMKDLGTPGHSYDFFENIFNMMPGVKILTIKHGNIAICCKFLLFYKDTVISMWGTTLEKYREFHPYDLANWKSIEYSHEKGYKYFDFGRCLINSGVFQYKEGWSNDKKQLYYQTYLNNTRKAPDISQTNPSRQRFAKVWAKLPIPVTKIIGPMLRKNFP